ncbi:hypothetical protein HEL01_003085, partial [Escherichia coli]|nr:hypothetical protein [Escherichia coli]
WSTSKTPSYTKSVSWQHHQITGENMIGANGRSVPEMALPESYNYIHKSGTLHEAPSPIIPLNWSKASMTLMLKEMSNLINDEGIK